MTPEMLAQLFHMTYERLAPDFGYKTREETAKPWEEVPEQNKMLMTKVAEVILGTMENYYNQRDCRSIGNVKNGDVVIIRYTTLPDHLERKRDYRMFSDYFARQGAVVRVLGMPMNMTLATVDEMTMGNYGWYKKGR